MLRIIESGQHKEKLKQHYKKRLKMTDKVHDVTNKVNASGLEK